MSIREWLRKRVKSSGRQQTATPDVIFTANFTRSVKLRHLLGNNCIHLDHRTKIRVRKALRKAA